jgi:uncharacterized protein
MKLLYSEIPEEGGVRIAFGGEDARWEGLKGFSYEAGPSGHLFVQRRGRDVHVEGEACATFLFDCSRCLDRFDHPVLATVRQILRPLGNGGVETKEIELKTEDLEYGTYDEDLIPLETVIEEHLLLALPMRPICMEGCKGLCSKCGENRNHAACGCQEDSQRSPFDCLKEFVVQKR